MRLAEKFGQDPRSERIADLLPEAKNHPDWQDITIGHCLNMATGIGTAAPGISPLNVFAGYLLEEEQASKTALGRKSFEHYFDWFLMPSQHQKNTAAFACPSYPSGPDKVARYRYQDFYIAARRWMLG
ncbi:MAG: CubicO group peptidase (beta-lactamase class C family) [Saprospiraceae bacterium]|jgi:CubicO group peptidase (beta-lactamase class C family)